MTAPESPQQSAARYKRDDDKIQRKLRTWERTGRRCDGNNRACLHNAATRELTVVNLDANGNDAGEPRTVKLCSRHHSTFERDNLTRLRIVSVKDIPPPKKPPRQGR